MNRPRDPRQSPCTRERRGARRSLVLIAFAIPALGCQSTEPPIDVVRIDPGRYEAAFDAAVASARAGGLDPVLRDRRAGLIEAGPAIAGSLLEPWRDAGNTMEQRVEHTIGLRRRRARFEFSPAVAVTDAETDAVAHADTDAVAHADTDAVAVTDAVADADTDADAVAHAVADAPTPTPPPTPLEGPDLFGLHDGEVDRTVHAGGMDLRVWVYLEQSYHPGLRYDTWSRSLTTRTVIVERDADGQPLQVPAVFWTPVARDRAFEDRLLREVRERLAAEEGAAEHREAG